MAMMMSSYHINKQVCLARNGVWLQWCLVTTEINWCVLLGMGYGYDGL